MLSVACDNDLDQSPDNIASADSLTDFGGVLNAAYYYQQGANTSMGVMGDFRSDNMSMSEAPYTDWNEFNSNLTSMEDQFFAPLNRNMFKAILSANNVITNSSDGTHIGEAKFLRALSYFKLVLTFGDVSVILTPSGSITDFSGLARQPAATVYSDVIIPDLLDAIATLDNSNIASGRASDLAARALLGKVYMHTGDFVSAEPFLQSVVNGATAVGVTLPVDFADVINDESSEIIFATQRSTSISDEYSFSEFTLWYGGTEDKAQLPLNADLTAAFDAAGDTTRKALTIDETVSSGAKYNGNQDIDWIEIRLADVILLHAEALNENTNASGANSATILGLLDDIRTRAGLASLAGTQTSQAGVRQAIQDERRLELAFEGHRWFDLVRTGTVDAEMGQTINSNYYVFPIPDSDITSSGGVITQNAGY